MYKQVFKMTCKPIKAGYATLAVLGLRQVRVTTSTIVRCALQCVQQLSFGHLPQALKTEMMRRSQLATNQASSLACERCMTLISEPAVARSVSNLAMQYVEQLYLSAGSETHCTIIQS